MGQESIVKRKQNDLWSGELPSMSLEGLGEVGEVVTEAADRTRAVFDAGVKVMQTESAQFLDDFSSQSEVALEQIARCKSPLEVIAVQQGWIQARSLAYLQSGLRVARTLAAASALKKSSQSEEKPHAAAAQQSARSSRGANHASA